MSFVLHVGDCVQSIRLMDESSLDSIVTDPPYELGFMGKSWDASGIANSVEMWTEALRVLKPGGHLLAFSGSRTYHRMVCAIEDAGFEIRDQIMWIYGSGFPKSLDVSKAIDKAAGAERKVIGLKRHARDGDVSGQAWASLSNSSAGYVHTGKTLGVGLETAPATDAARQWQGWGTALKPAHEPIVVARKPLIGTVAANVLAHGTGAINVDRCRVLTTDNLNGGAYSDTSRKNEFVTDLDAGAGQFVQPIGRWPANLIHDGSDQVLAAFPQARSAGQYPSDSTTRKGVTSFAGKQSLLYDDAGSAARFFYCAKASKSDRSADNVHPTVKPTELMRYLVRLVTPPGGVVLDPFAGSGSTGKAAMLEGFQFIGCELSPEYAAIAKYRIEEALRGLQNTFDFSESPLQSEAR